MRKGSLFAAYAVALVLFLVLLPAGAGAADATAVGIVPVIENGKRVYTAAQFIRFAPQSAADIVQQIPGFAISQVSDDRGLGEASQNVLINGQRITGKGNDADAALRKIPVKAIRRLEIVDGATLDISGLIGDVLNVWTEQGAIEGHFEWRPQIRQRIQDYWLGGEASMSGKAAGGDFALGYRMNGFRGGGWGTETEFHPADNLTILRDMQPRFANDGPRISGSYNYKTEAGALWNLNASVEHQHFRRKVTALYQFPNEALTTEIGRSSNKKWRTELGGDYEFALGAGRLKLVGFFAERVGPSGNELTRRRADAAVPTGSRFAQESTEGERVLRAEYRWKALGGDLSLSGEGAYNFVDVAGALDVLDSAGAYQPIQFDGATARVEELRGESVLSYSKALAEGWSLQVSGGVEHSKLSQDGEAGQTRRFWRPKGAVSVAWKLSNQWEASLRLQRKVGQLNFFDFLASADLGQDTTNASNPELIPPQSWVTQLEVSRSLGAIGRIKLNIENESITHIVDQIPISATLEATGNLPKASRLQFNLTSSLLLDAVGIPGGKLDTFISLTDSSVRDPLFGTNRQLNGNRRNWSVDFRQDVPGTPWTWGLFAEQSSKSYFYRLDYLQVNYQEDPFGMLFLEHKNVWGFKARIAIANLFNTKERTQQYSYVDRRNGPLDYSRDFSLTFKPIIRLALSGTF